MVMFQFALYLYFRELIPLFGNTLCDILWFVAKQKVIHHYNISHDDSLHSLMSLIRDKALYSVNLTYLGVNKKNRDKRDFTIQIITVDNRECHSDPVPFSFDTRSHYLYLGGISTADCM